MKFSIGEFSKITSLTIKTLRLYHEKQLLIPSEVDEFTSYRYYDDENIDRARVIKTLKDYDFTLTEIKEILDECDSESDIKIQLKEKLKDIKSKIDRYNEISNSIEIILNKAEDNKMENINEFEVEEKEIETVLIAGYRMKGKYSDSGEGFKKLAKSFGRHLNGKPMNLFYDSEYKEDDADFETCFPIRKGNDKDDIKVREIKGGKCGSLIHKGPYENLSDSYKNIFEYSNSKGYKTKLPSREVYLKGPGMIFKGNPKNYLTEIQMMIEE